MSREQLGLPTDWNIIKKWDKKGVNFGVLLQNDSCVAKNSNLPNSSFLNRQTACEQFPIKTLYQGWYPTAKKNWTINRKRQLKKRWNIWLYVSPLTRSLKLEYIFFRSTINSSISKNQGCRSRSRSRSRSEPGFLAGAEIFTRLRLWLVQILLKFLQINHLKIFSLL